MNDFLKREFNYSFADDDALLMHTLKHNTELAKIDIRKAYHIIPIHHKDQPLIGIMREGQVYTCHYLCYYHLCH